MNDNSIVLPREQISLLNKQHAKSTQGFSLNVNVEIWAMIAKVEDTVTALNSGCPKELLKRQIQIFQIFIA